jgi:hypothetical protein
MAPEDQFALGEADYEDSETVLSMTGRLLEYGTRDVNRGVATSCNLIPRTGKITLTRIAYLLERAGSRHFEALFRAGRVSGGSFRIPDRPGA